MSTQVFIDESGDLGRKSKFIVFASIQSDSPRQIEKAIKKIWKAKPQLHSHGELHANSVDDSTRIRVLKTLTELDIAFKYVVLDKATQKDAPLQVYYQRLATFIALHGDAHVIIVDKKDTNKKRMQIIDILGLQQSFEGVLFEESHKVKQLQAVDFVAWAIARFYETGEDTFIELIQSRLNELA